jgi:predicted dehydrogenase
MPLHTDLTAIESALTAGRIGTPVAARLIDCTVADHGQIETRLAQGLEAAAGWLRSDVIRLAAVGSAGNGHASVLAQCRRGQMALVSAGVRGQSPPLIEALVVGNQGIVSYEPGGVDALSASEEAAESPLSQGASALLAAVRHSLTTGEAVAPGEELTPGERGNIGPRSTWPRSTGPIVPSAGPALYGPAAIGRPDPPWGVLLIAGNQTHQENYARSLAADRRCRLIGLTDAADISPRRRALNERLARELAIPYLDDMAAALARDDVHIASICAEPERRGPIIMHAAQAGKHLYLDKPLAATADEAAAIAAAIERASGGGGTGLASHMFSMWPGPVAARLRALAEAGTLGELAALHADLFFAKGHAGGAMIERPRVESARPTRFEEVQSKRELYNIGVYPLVNLAALTRRRVRRVFALTGNYFFAENVANDMEDFGAMLLELEGGLTATVMAGRTGWRSHPAGGVHRACLAGARGVAVIDAHRPRVETWDDREPWTAPARHPDDPMGMWSSTFAANAAADSAARPKQSWHVPGPADWSDAAYFLDHLEQGIASPIDAHLAADVLRVQMAAYASAASGRFVSFA